MSTDELKPNKIRRANLNDAQKALEKYNARIETANFRRWWYLRRAGAKVAIDK